MTRLYVVIGIFAVWGACPALRGQGRGSADSWYMGAALAQQIFTCTAPDQTGIPDPVGATRALLEKALREIDQVKSADPDERMRLGALRANLVKRLDEVMSRQTAWMTALQNADALFKKAFLDQAAETVKHAEPLPCAADFRELNSRIAQTRAQSEALKQQGDKALLAARSSFDLKRARQLCQDALAKYIAARALNLDDQTLVSKAAEAKDLLANLSSVDKHDVLILSDPGGAQVALQGDGEERVCPATPCKFRLETAYFDSSGGSFLNSKRLLRPLVAILRKEGYKTEEVPLTNPGTFRGSVPGEKITIQFYFLAKTRFEKTLTPVKSP